MSAFIVAIFPSVEDSISEVVEKYPAGLKEAFGIGRLSNVEQYLHAEMMSLIVPLALGYLAVRAVASGLAGAAETGRLDVLLSAPVSRHRLCAAGFLATAIELAAVLVSLPESLLAVPLGRRRASRGHCWCVARASRPPGPDPHRTAGGREDHRAAMLAGRSSAPVHVEADRFFSFIHGGFVEPWDPASAEQNELAMGIAASAAASYAEAGYATIFEGIVIPRWTLGVVRDAFEAAGMPASYAVLRAPHADVRRPGPRARRRPGPVRTGRPRRDRLRIRRPGRLRAPRASTSRGWMPSRPPTAVATRSPTGPRL